MLRVSSGMFNDSGGAKKISAIILINFKQFYHLFAAQMDLYVCSDLNTA